ncbi:unnamed protein product [Ixodes pacificus]
MAEGTASEEEHPSDGEPSKRYCESQGVCETEERERDKRVCVWSPLVPSKNGPVDESSAPKYRIFRRWLGYSCFHARNLKRLAMSSIRNKTTNAAEEIGKTEMRRAIEEETR